MAGVRVLKNQYGVVWAADHPYRFFPPERCHHPILHASDSGAKPTRAEAVLAVLASDCILPCPSQTLNSVKFTRQLV